MRGSRREFLGASVVSLLASAGVPRFTLGRAVSETYFDWKKAVAGAHVAFGEGGNAMVLLAGTSALLVDCKNAPFGAALRREAAGLGARLTIVVNTHHHADHTGGNTAFTADLPLVTHENARPRILAQTQRYLDMIRGGVAQVSRSTNPASKPVLEDARALADGADRLKPQDWAPTRTVGDHEELDVGGTRVVLHHFGPGHTDNDVVVHVPSLNLLHAGDLLFSGLHPFMDPPGGANSPGWIESVRQAIALCDDKTVVVPGHGVLTDVGGLRRQIEYFEKTRAAVADAIAQGKTREQVQAIELAEFKSLGFDQARPRALGAIYDEMKSPGR
jgi:glyoxylase-like metal-dependent hydrolase (beta-lactamase superfamily II)